MVKPDAQPVPEPVRTSAQSETDRLVDGWLIDHFGTATPQFFTLAAKEDLKSRIRAALKEGG